MTGYHDFKTRWLTEKWIIIKLKFLAPESFIFLKKKKYWKSVARPSTSTCTVRKVVKFPRYNMKRCGKNLHEIFRVVSRFPLYFMLHRGKSIFFRTVNTTSIVTEKWQGTRSGSLARNWFQFICYFHLIKLNPF